MIFIYHFTSLLYVIAKIALMTARIIASLDFISTVHICICPSTVRYSKSLGVLRVH